MLHLLFGCPHPAAHPALTFCSHCVLFSSTFSSCRIRWLGQSPRFSAAAGSPSETVRGPKASGSGWAGLTGLAARRCSCITCGTSVGPRARWPPAPPRHGCRGHNEKEATQQHGWWGGHPGDVVMVRGVESEPWAGPVHHLSPRALLAPAAGQQWPRLALHRRLAAAKPCLAKLCPGGYL